MSKSFSTMTQCTLSRIIDNNPEKIVTDVRWIETRLSSLGKLVRVKETGEIWKVIERGETWPTERVLAYEKDFVSMATVTDAFRETDPVTGKKRRRYPVKPEG